MNYTFDIIDTQDDTLTTQLVKAEGGSIIVEWKGGDRKDDLFLVGSSASFTMVGMSREDGQFLDLFTGDETRYKVRMTDSDSNILMEWFILPDSYSEPYSNSPILIDFEAVDGLGRLKGKYLPEDYYQEEKSVIEILSQCLKLTGLNLSFRFAPAIENSQQKDYNKIYIDTGLFEKDKKKQDAHEVLEDLLESMCCTLYQADNCWNIEGLNIRNFQVYDTKIYSPSGQLTGEVQMTRNRRTIQGIRPTVLNMQAPYGVIDIRHKREPLGFAETVAEEENEGWALERGSEEYIYASDWIGQEGLHAWAHGDNGQVYFGKRTPNTNQLIFLRNRPYLKKGGKYRLNIEFEIESIYTYDQMKDTGHWTNPFIIQIRQYYINPEGILRPKVLYTNIGADGFNAQDIPQVFGSEKTATTKLSFVSNYDGPLDVQIFGINNTDDSGIHRVYINELELEDIAFEKEYVSEILSEQDYTLKKELELEYADDATGLSKAFRLQKLRTPGDFTVEEVDILSQFEKDGYWYAIASLSGANLIDDNIKGVFQDGNPIQVEEVIYNYNNSQEHVLKLNDKLIDNGTSGRTHPFVTVNVYDYNAISENRSYWEQWTDSLYKIEQKRYVDVVANMYSLLHKAPIFKIDFPVKDNITFNNFIDFDFLGNKQFMLANCRWDVDKGFAELMGIQAFYGVEAGVNLPPVVEAGPDIYITIDQNEVLLSCEAYDPDGYIVSYKWEEVTNNGAVFFGTSSSEVRVVDLTEDFYTFKVTVTDNEGATATDTVNVYRTQTVTASLEETYFEGSTNFSERHFKLHVDPDIAEGSAVNIRGLLYSKISGTACRTRVRVQIDGRGTLLLVETITSGGGSDEGEKTFSLNYTKGSEVTFEILAEKEGSGANIDTSFSIDVMEFVDGTGNVEGLPLGYQILV